MTLNIDILFRLTEDAFLESSLEKHTLSDYYINNNMSLLLL